LSQEGKDNAEHPVAFFLLSIKGDIGYSTREKECLAVVAALKHFEVHLIGQEFTVVTDHTATKYLRKVNLRVTEMGTCSATVDICSGTSTRNKAQHC
jgi:hypothetical protein